MWLAAVRVFLVAGACAARVAVHGVYGVQSTVLLAAAERGAAPLGYRLEAELAVAELPRAGAGADTLLYFTLSRPQLLVRGAHRSAEWQPRESAWAAGGGGGAAARLRAGALRAAYLHPADPRDVADYKRSLVSLFQFQADGEYNETDVSGACDVLYETLSDAEFRKIKVSCGGDAAAGAAARRVARYSAARGALDTLHAEEVVELHGELKARSWHALRRLAAERVPAPPADPLAALRPAALTPPPPDDDDDEDARAELGAALAEHRAALEGEEPGAGGGAGAARALLRLLPALQAAPPAALLAALRDGQQRARLPGLCRALGLAGTPAALRAARAFLQLAAPDPLEPLARAFLAGLALAPAPAPAAALDALALAGEARHSGVRDAALLAAAAAAHASGDASARAAVREALARGLARCAEAECRAVRLLALANLRAEAADAALAAAEGDAPVAASAALAALGAAPALGAAALARLGRLAGNASRPLEVRAAALELVVARRAAGAADAVPLQLLEVARALHAERGRAAHELRRVLWQRLAALADAAPVRALLRLLPPQLRSWDARAHAGTSSVLRRDTGWAEGGALDSAQVALGGLLRRGAVRLLAEGAAPDLEVEVWTRGLEALAGGAAPEGAEPEGAAGGLALAVGGARLPPVTLFSGQAELLAAVWAGAGSAPTAVLRALRPAPGARAHLPLLCGSTARVRRAAAAALALDAHATASLWHRTARAALALRTARVRLTDVRVRTAWAHLNATAERETEPRLRIALDLDFYDAVAVCVRAASPDHHALRTLRLSSEAGARRMRVSRGGTWRRAAAGRSLALGRANDAACRALRPPDRDDDE